MPIEIGAYRQGDMDIAFADPADFFYVDGNMRQIHEVPEYARTALSKILKRGNGTVYEVYYKHKGLQRLYEFMGLLQRNVKTERSGASNAIANTVIQIMLVEKSDEQIS